MRTIEDIKNYFERDRFVINSRIEISEITAEYAVCSAKIEDCHLNAGDVVQGGMIYTLADFAFAVHANSIHPVTVTQSASISYVAPAAGCNTLFAKAKEIVQTGKTCVYEVLVYDEKSRIFAAMTVNGFIKTAAANA